jgi:hypothetical protein
MHISEAYIRLCSHLACCISIDVQMIYTLSPTRARDSVNSHVTHKHLLKRCKFRKNAGLKHRQLVVVEIKPSVGRREETVRGTLCTPERTRSVCVSASARVTSADLQLDPVASPQSVDPVASPQSVNCFYGEVCKTLRSHKCHF